MGDEGDVLFHFLRLQIISHVEGAHVTVYKVLKRFHTLFNELVCSAILHFCVSEIRKRDDTVATDHASVFLCSFSRVMVRSCRCTRSSESERSLRSSSAKEQRSNTFFPNIAGNIELYTHKVRWKPNVTGSVRLKNEKMAIRISSTSNKEQLERLKKKNVEIQYNFLYEHVIAFACHSSDDEYFMQYLMDFEDKKFQNVSKEGLKLGKEYKDKGIEINERHPIIKELRERVVKDPEVAKFAATCFYVQAVCSALLERNNGDS
ncbi:endoplasmin [Tanacetum coccineum]